MWIHWWSSVASANALTRAWSTSSHSLGPRRSPTCAWSFSLRSDICIPLSVLTASCQRSAGQEREGSRAPTHAPGLVAQSDAAVDDERLAGDPARVVAEQERCGLGGVLRHAQALERVGLRDLLLTALVQRA